MSDDMVRIVLLAIIGVTALCTLSFPILFSRYNWRRTPIGRALMIKSSSTALAISVTFLMSLIHPPYQVRLVVYVIAFSAIAISSLRLTWTMLRINNADRVAPLRQKDEARK